MSTAIRHVDVDPEAPLAAWPYEALVTLIERRSVRDWATGLKPSSSLVTVESRSSRRSMRASQSCD